MISRLPMPERRATWTKGRSFRLSACERTARAGQAQAKRPMIRAIVADTDTAQQRGDQDQEEERGHGEEDVDQDAQSGVDLAAEVAGDESDQRRRSTVPIVAAMRPTWTELGTAWVHWTTTLWPSERGAEEGVRARAAGALGTAPVRRSASLDEETADQGVTAIARKTVRPSDEFVVAQQEAAGSSARR